MITESFAINSYKKSQAYFFYNLRIIYFKKMMNLIMQGANMIIKHKRNQGKHHQGGSQQGAWGGQQQQGGWGGQQQQQGGWGGQQQGGWGGQEQQGGWGGQQGAWQQGGWGGQQQQGSGSGWEGQKGDGWGTGFIGEASKQQWGNNLDGWQWVQQQKKRNDFNVINTGQQQNLNIQQFIQQQIVFIEPSPAQKKIQQLKRQGRVFNDDSFPPNQASLTGDYGPDPEWAPIKWVKITSVMKNPALFHGKVEPGDIKQGYLGDCYFLAGLAAIAERPDRIFNLFLTQELNQQRYFSVKMLYKGKWMTVDMDEYVPWLGNQPAFSRANQDQLWVILLQKAWAKLYTSYKRIEAGYPQQTLHDLTGAPIRQILLKNASFNKQAEWQYLVEASQKQYAMVASSNPGSDTNKSVSGVVQGHAYTVLNATNINFQGRQQRIIQLRNPWGKGQFTGRWSDNDSNWNYVSPEQKQRIGYRPDATDGLFYMPFDQFCQEFRAITVAEVDDNASYVYKSVKDKELKGAFFTIEVFANGLYSFQVDKTPERIYPDKYQQMFQYPEALIEVGKLQGNSIQKYQGLRSAKRTLVQKHQLGPGKYVAFVKISYSRDFEDQFDVNLAIYAPTACTIRLASREEAAIFSGNSNVQWSGAQTQSQRPWNTMGNVVSGGNNIFSPEQQQQQQQGGSGQNQQGQGQGGWGGQEISFGGQGGQGGNGGWGGQQGGQQGWGGQQNQGWDSQQNQGWGGQNQGW